MREAVNDCVHCGADSCAGCTMTDREVLCCDNCGKEINEGYEYDGATYCGSCVLKELWYDDVIKKVS